MDTQIAIELAEMLERNSAVHATWIAGSVAEGYEDELSDIDLWLDIDDGTDETIFGLIEKFLSTKGKLDLNFSEGITPPFSHKTYHLAHMEPLHFIEVNLHSHSHHLGLFDRMRQIKVLFDKDGTTAFEPFDETSYNQMLKERKQFLTEKIALGELSVKKEVTRWQFLEALHNYQFWLVEPVIELARIKYSPRKISYGLKQASRDLPGPTVKEIESLYVIASLEDLGKKVEEVKAMARKYS